MLPATDAGAPLEGGFVEGDFAGRGSAGRDPAELRTPQLPDLAQRAPGAGLVEVGSEEVAEVLYEQRAGTREAVVVGGVPTQHEQLLGAGDGGVEEVALGCERVP